jgi:ribosomal protein S18 acetylase RimI-like enzyme
MIIKAESAHLPQILELNQQIVKYMQSLGFSHWSERYPTEAVYRLDISRGSQYLYMQENELIAIVSLDEHHHEYFDSIQWEPNNRTSYFVHRLAVSPKYQGRGIAKELMTFCEDKATANNIDSLKLGAFKGYDTVVNFYQKLGYLIMGEILFDVSKVPFYGMEKTLRAN